MQNVLFQSRFVHSLWTRHSHQWKIINEIFTTFLLHRFLTCTLLPTARRLLHICEIRYYLIAFRFSLSRSRKSLNSNEWRFSMPKSKLKNQNSLLHEWNEKNSDLELHNACDFKRFFVWCERNENVTEATHCKICFHQQKV